jgi:nucleotide-binding universal stress UspA family protein
MTTAPDQATAVVVGVDGAANSRTAIRLAAREAGYRDATLVAVMAYSASPALAAPAARPVATLHTADETRLSAESALHDAVVDALGDQAGRVEQRAMPGMAGRNLVAVARSFRAELLVVAGRGAASVLPGTVSQYLLRKAPCPVLIVPDAGPGQPPG